MATATATINLSPLTSDLERALRIIAKHAEACADELAAIRAENAEAAS